MVNHHWFYAFPLHLLAGEPTMGDSGRSDVNIEEVLQVPKFEHLPSVGTWLQWLPESDVMDVDESDLPLDLLEALEAVEWLSFDEEPPEIPKWGAKAKVGTGGIFWIHLEW